VVVGDQVQKKKQNASKIAVEEATFEGAAWQQGAESCKVPSLQGP
jgi:hypothetical protein